MLGDDSVRFCAALLADLGGEFVRDLDDACDVALLGGTPGALAERNLAPSDLRRRHPALIVAVISPFGLRGPRADWRSGELVAQATGGLLFVNGHAGQPPLPLPGPQALQCAGLHAVIGIALALRAREQSGRGHLVDVSLQESAAAMLEHVTGAYRDDGLVQQRRGTRHWSGMFDVVSCADGAALVSHTGDWTALVEWMRADGAAADLVDPRWCERAVRMAECDHVFAVMSAWASRYPVAELVAQAQLRRLPFAPVRSIREATEHPQLSARGFFTEPPWRRPPGRRGRRPGPSIENAAALRAAAGTKAGATGDRAPLDGIRVLDFTWVVAGPLATRVLADHGADVIKVERLDAARSGRDTASFANLHRGKRSIAVDLSTARGVALARDLAARCDIVIDNFSPRVLANWGLDAAALQRTAPHVISVRLSGYGATGPYANAVSYGPTLQAETGLTWAMRHSGGPPAGCGFAFADTVSAYWTVLAVLLALGDRARTGRGAAVDLAQLELTAGMLRPLYAEALRGGTPAPDAAPDGVYRCRDGADGAERWCAVSAYGDDDWQRLAAIMGQPGWVADPRFATHTARVVHAAALDAEVAAWARQAEVEALVEALQRGGVAAGVVADVRDLAADPQLTARGYWVPLPSGPILDGVVPQLSPAAGRITGPGPGLGEHTDTVLHELLGLEQSARDRLRADRIIG
jgi:crotonobetainyl-CoA:carnitine CoA-transferase CaiB-like acyl-CoA transferase